MDPESKTKVMRLAFALFVAYVLFRVALNHIYPA